MCLTFCCQLYGTHYSIAIQRQLNYFGFRKIAGKGKMAPCSYINDAATGDLKSLLSIRRKATVSNTKRRKQQAAQANKIGEGARKRQKKAHHLSATTTTTTATACGGGALTTDLHYAAPVSPTPPVSAEDSDVHFDLSDAFLGTGPGLSAVVEHTSSSDINIDENVLLDDCMKMDEHFSFIVPADALNFLFGNNASNDCTTAAKECDEDIIDDAHCPNAVASAAMDAAVSAATQQQDFFESSLSFLDKSVDYGEVTDDSGGASSCDSSLVDLAMLPELDNNDNMERVSEYYHAGSYDNIGAGRDRNQQQQQVVSTVTTSSYYQSQRFKGKTKPPLISSIQSGPVTLVG